MIQDSKALKETREKKYIFRYPEIEFSSIQNYL